MDLEQIVTEVCKQVNDPNKKTYGERVPELFHSAVCELIDAEKYNEQEIYNLIKNEHLLMVSGDFWAELPNDDVYKIVGVWRHPSESGAQTYTYIPIEQMDTITTNTALKPFTDEYFWTLMGKDILIYPVATADLSLSVRYIKSPDLEGNDYPAMNDVFIRKAIAVTVQKIRIEIAGE